MKNIVIALVVLSMPFATMAQVKKKKEPAKTKMIKFTPPKIVQEEMVAPPADIEVSSKSEAVMEDRAYDSQDQVAGPERQRNNRTAYGKTGKYFLESISIKGSYYDNYYGITDINNKIILPTIFSEISETEDMEGQSLLRLGSLYSLVDQNFNTILPMEYLSITSMGINDLYLVSDGSDYYNKKIVDIKGKSILDENKYIINTLYYGKLYGSKTHNKYVRVLDKVLNKNAIYDISKKEFVTEFLFDEISDSEYGITVRKNLGYNFLNDEFKEVMPKLFTSIQVVKEGLFILNDNGKYGLVNMQGNFIAPLEYKNISYLYNPMSLFLLTKNNEASIIDTKGKVIFGNDYQSIVTVGENNFAVKKNNKWGVTNILQSEVLPIIYDTVIVSYKNVVAKGKKVYIMNISSGIVKETAFTNIERFNYDYYKVYNGNKVGVLNEYLEEILPVEFDDISSYYENDYLFRVVKAGKYGTYSKTGKILVPVLYDKIQKLGDLYASVVKLNGKYGLLNSYGQLIEPCEYDFIGTDRNDIKTVICVKGTTYKKIKVASRY